MEPTPADKQKAGLCGCPTDTRRADRYTARRFCPLRPLSSTDGDRPPLMLWISQFFPDEGWTRVQKARCLGMLERMWLKDGYFCREPWLPQVSSLCHFRRCGLRLA